MQSIVSRIPLDKKKMKEEKRREEPRVLYVPVSLYIIHKVTPNCSLKYFIYKD